MKTTSIVFLVLSLVGCASSVPPRCTGTARHVNHPGVPVAAVDVICPDIRGG
jgi:hypothetical protein